MKIKKVGYMLLVSLGLIITLGFGVEESSSYMTDNVKKSTVFTVGELKVKDDVFIDHNKKSITVNSTNIGNMSGLIDTNIIIYIEDKDGFEPEKLKIYNSSQVDINEQGDIFLKDDAISCNTTYILSKGIYEITGNIVSNCIVNGNNELSANESLEDRIENTVYIFDESNTLDKVTFKIETTIKHNNGGFCYKIQSIDTINLESTEEL